MIYLPEYNRRGRSCGQLGTEQWSVPQPVNRPSGCNIGKLVKVSSCAVAYSLQNDDTLLLFSQAVDQRDAIMKQAVDEKLLDRGRQFLPGAYGDSRIKCP